MAMGGNAKQRVVIAGGGTAGWMVAAALAKTMGPALEITLIESDEIGTVGVGEATIPPIITYNRMLDLNEQEFMVAMQATFKLGIRFENWRRLGDTYIHSFGAAGTDHWSAGFQHFWLRGRERGLASGYEDYCIEAKAAELNRFGHLPRGGMNYAYHLDATLYAGYLRRYSEPLGVRRIEGRILEVVLRPGDGSIDLLRLDHDRTVAGDMFVDCTGFRGLLIEQALHAGYEDWTHWLPCDSAVAVQTEAVAPPAPYTRSIARDAGWQWRIPLQNRVGNGLVYCSRYSSDDQAREVLLANVEGKRLTEPRLLRFRAGCRRRHWVKNCVAIGLASGFIEPLESTSIHLIQRGIIRFAQLMPAGRPCQAEIDEYNAQMALEFAQVRDFIVLHYHLTERSDTPFWRHCAVMEIPETLKHRIALFREGGRVFRTPGELFAENSWIQVMLGQGVEPTHHHLVTSVMSDEELAGFLNTIRDDVARIVGQLPTHQDYLRQYCGAAQPAARG